LDVVQVYLEVELTSDVSSSSTRYILMERLPIPREGLGSTVRYTVRRSLTS